MKRIIALAAFAALSACSQKAEEAPAPAETTAAEAAAEVPGGLAIDGKPNAGVFEVTHADGRKWTTTVMADGKTSTVTDGVTKSGTWTSTGPGNYCETADGKTNCYKEEIIDGVYTSTNEKDPKDTSTIKRVE
jgi:ABC-type Fe3+-hydroxamate transport system substrate-binding protein